MTDQLRQALEHDEMRVRKGLVSSDPLLVAAARAYADLLENGENVEAETADEDGTPTQWWLEVTAPGCYLVVRVGESP